MDVLPTEEIEAMITASTDQIIVSELVCRNVVGLERWERRKEQRLFISFTIWADIRQTGQTDNLSYGHNYGLCASLVTQYAEQAHFRTAEGVACGVARLLIVGCGVTKCSVRVIKPASLLFAGGAGVEVHRTCRDYPIGFTRCMREKKLLLKGATEFVFPEESTVVAHPEDMVLVNDLLVRCIIGCNPWERERKQNVIINLTFFADCGAAGASDALGKTIDYRSVCGRVVEAAEASDFKTLEAFITSVAKLCVVECGVPRVTVRAQKPSALVFADSAGVQITRSAADF